MSDPILDGISTAVRDVLKFNIIRNISSGDKTYDSLLQQLCLALLSFFLAFCSLSSLKLKWKLYRLRKGKCKIDKEIDAWYNKEIEEGRISISRVAIDRHEPKIFRYFLMNTHRCIGAATIIRDKKVIANPVKIDTSVIRTCLEPNKYTTILVDGKDILGLYYDVTNYYIYLYYTSEKILEKFLEEIEKVDITEKVQDKPGFGDITEFAGDAPNGVPATKNVSKSLYRSWTMDSFISKHKPTIIKALDRFLAVNRGESMLGGFCDYNLGMLLHGGPGSGKSLLMKIVANYTNRGIFILDMKLLRTKKAFQSFFSNEEIINNNVIVLDEFDFVQDVIRDRDDEKTETDSKSRLKELQDRYLAVMKLTGRSVKDGENNMQKELETIRNAIKDEEDSLTLDTILQTLCGVKEIRNMIIMATTNYIDRIDKALLRPGRFGLKIHLDKFDEKETEEMLIKMYGSIATKAELSRLKSCSLPSGKYTPAELIELARTSDTLTDILNVMGVSP